MPMRVQVHCPPRGPRCVGTRKMVVTGPNYQEQLRVALESGQRDRAVALLEQLRVPSKVMAMVTSQGPHAGAAVHGFEIWTAEGTFVPDLFLVPAILDSGGLAIQALVMEELRGMRLTPLVAEFTRLLMQTQPEMAAAYAARFNGAMDLLSRSSGDA